MAVVRIGGILLALWLAGLGVVRAEFVAYLQVDGARLREAVEAHLGLDRAQALRPWWGSDGPREERGGETEAFADALAVVVGAAVDRGEVGRARAFLAALGGDLAASSEHVRLELSLAWSGRLGPYERYYLQTTGLHRTYSHRYPLGRERVSPRYSLAFAGGMLLLIGFLLALRRRLREPGRQPAALAEPAGEPVAGEEAGEGEAVSAGAAAPRSEESRTRCLPPVPEATRSPQPPLDSSRAPRRARLTLQDLGMLLLYLGPLLGILTAWHAGELDHWSCVPECGRPQCRASVPIPWGVLSLGVAWLACLALGTVLRLLAPGGSPPEDRGEGGLHWVAGFFGLLLPLLFMAARGGNTHSHHHVHGHLEPVMLAPTPLAPVPGPGSSPP